MDHIKPQWDIEDFKNLDYTYATHNDPLLVNEYLWQVIIKRNFPSINIMNPIPCQRVWIM